MDNRVLVCAVAMLLLTGCGQGSDSQKASKTKAFIGGTQGMTMEFLTGSPPPEVFDNSTFPFEVAVKLENKGEFDVSKEKAEIKISGIQAQDFGLQPSNLTKNPDENLDAAEIDPEGSIIPGTVSFLTFPGFKYKTRLSGNTPFTVVATNCYTYGTNAQALLCIRDDLLKPDEDAGCKVSEKKSAQSSGSPIQITSFEENPAGSDRVTFSFQVEHRGTGRITKQGTRCNNDDIVADDDKVWVEVSTGDITSGLSCSGLEGGSSTTGFVRLFGGKRLIRCTQQKVPGFTGDFEKIVKIKALFDYKESITTPLLVKHST